MLDFYFSNKGVFTRKNYWIGILSSGLFFTILNTFLELLGNNYIIINLMSSLIQLFVLYNIYKKRLNHIGKYHKLLYLNIFCYLIFMIYSVASAINLFSGETVQIFSFFSVIVLSLILLIICGFFPGNNKILPKYEFYYKGKLSNIFSKDLYDISIDFVPDFSNSGVIFIRNSKYDVFFDSETYNSSDKNGQLYVFHLKNIH